MSGYIGYREGSGTKFVKVGEPTGVTAEGRAEKAPTASLEPFSGSVTLHVDETMEACRKIIDAHAQAWSEAVYATRQMRRLAFNILCRMAKPEFDVPSAEYGVPSVRERVSRLFGRSEDAQDRNMAQDAVRA